MSQIRNYISKNHVCDICHQGGGIIVGPRYHCITCPVGTSFDVCSDCHQNGYHRWPTHGMSHNAETHLLVEVWNDKHVDRIKKLSTTTTTTTTTHNMFTFTPIIPTPRPGEHDMFARPSFGYDPSPFASAGVATNMTFRAS